MVRRSRRSVLRAAAAGFGPLGTGCAAPSNTGSPTAPPGRATPTPDRADEPTDGVSTDPAVDERVEATPPGAPALDPGGAWPALRFDAANTGWNPDGTGLRDGATYWRLNAGGAASVADGTLFNVASRDRATTALTYRDPATASVEMSSDLVRYGVNPPPVVADGRVLVTTFVEVFCFDARRGEQLWRGPPMDGIRSQPTVHGGHVLVNSAGYQDVDPQLGAFDAASGDELWRYGTGHDSGSTPAVADGRAFVSSEGGLHAVDLASGEEAFVVPDVAARRSSPVVDDGTVFAVSDDAAGEAHELVALDAGDGTERWRVPVGTDRPPVVTDDAVYAFAEGAIAELDRADGSVLASAFGAGPVALVGDVLYAVRGTRAHALDAANDLEPLWSLRTEEVQVSDYIGGAVRHVTPVDGAVYVDASDAFYGVGPDGG